MYILCVWISTKRFENINMRDVCVRRYMYYYVSKNVDYINHSNLLSRSFYQLDARTCSS